MFDWTVFDAEGDGLEPTKFYCLSYEDSAGTKGTVTDYADMRSLFGDGRRRVVVGHNIIRWDIPNLTRVCLLDFGESTIYVDTLAVAWYLDPLRRRHGLESYGEDFGIAKPVIHDWDGLQLQEYINRCETDVQINVKLWKSQLSRLTQLYDSPDTLWDFLRYLSFKLDCAREQEESGWKLDVNGCQEELSRLEAERDKKVPDLAKAMPDVAIWDTRNPPKRMLKADGEPSELAKKWFEFLGGQRLPRDHGEPVDYITGYKPPNPNYSVEIKSWLTSLGWKPRTFKYVRDKKTGVVREIPQINLPHGEGICSSISDLYPTYPDLELLGGLSVLNHRIGILSGFLRDEKDGRLSARIAGLTNTLRFKHSEIVNLPKVDRPYAEGIRRSLIADDGHELCGADMVSLEDRLKQHYIYPYDPEYVKELMDKDYDPHLDIAIMANLMSKRDAKWYKEIDGSSDDFKRALTQEGRNRYKKLKTIRGIAKNGNYACQYGAGVGRLMLTCDIERDVAGNLHKAYWKKNWAIKAVAEAQIVKKIGDQMWLLNPISGFWYSLRTEKDVFSTLVQGSAAFVFDLWVKKVRDIRPQLTAQFHDEIVLSIKKGFRDDATRLLMETISEVNDLLTLNRELSISVQFGENYAAIH